MAEFLSSVEFLKPDWAAIAWAVSQSLHHNDCHHFSSIYFQKSYWTSKEVYKPSQE